MSRFVKTVFKKSDILTKQAKTIKDMLTFMLKHTEIPYRGIGHVFPTQRKKVKGKGNLTTSIVLSEFFA